MLEKYLSQKGLVNKVLTIPEIISLSKGDNKINIVMGQTFDSGQPLDMMKYAIFMMDLKDLISQESKGIVKSSWIIADHFMTSINKEKSFNEATNQAKKRINYLKKLNQIYSGNIEFVLSSQLIKSKEYKNNLLMFKELCERNHDLKKQLLESVPLDRRSNPLAFNYALEELATIQTLGTQIKIGPPYEAKYDIPAREFSKNGGIKKYSAIYLTKCLPLGNPSINNSIQEEINNFGVLPYKINSKGLARNRIDPTKDNLQKVNTLIDRTNHKENLLGLLVILEMAKRRLYTKAVGLDYFASEYNGLLRGIQDKNKKNRELNKLKDLSKEMYKQFIFSQLKE